MKGSMLSRESNGNIIEIDFEKGTSQNVTDTQKYLPQASGHLIMTILNEEVRDYIKML